MARSGSTGRVGSWAEEDIRVAGQLLASQTARHDAGKPNWDLLAAVRPIELRRVV